MTETTIANVKASSPLFPSLFYSTDAGREAFWYLDNTDTTSPNDDYAVLVCANSKRVKRIFDGVFNVKWFGAMGDCKYGADGATTQLSATFTAGLGKFTSADVGKTIVIKGIDASGNSLALRTTVSTYSSATSITLSTTAAYTVTNAKYTILGTDDTTAINNALSFMPDINLVFPPGIYMVSQDLRKNTAPTVGTPRNGSIEIKFEKGSQIYVDIENYSYSAGTRNVAISGFQNGIFNFKNLNSVKINGAFIDGRRSSLTSANTPDHIAYSSLAVFSNQWVPGGFQTEECDNIIIENCTINEPLATGISVLYATNVILKNNIIYKPGAHGIFVQNCYNTQVLKNNIEGLDFEVTSNTTMGGIGILLQKSEDLYISENKIFKMTDTGTKSEGCNYVSWVKNHVKEFGKDGIKFQDYDVSGGTTNVYSVHHCIMDGNVVEDMLIKRTDGSACMLAYSAENVTMVNNEINSHKRSTTTLVNPPDNTLKHDDIGIFINGSYNTTYNLTIANNIIKDTPKAVVVGNVSYGKVANNILQDCITGVSIEQSSNIEVNNNILSRSSAPDSNISNWAANTVYAKYSIVKAGSNIYQSTQTGNGTSSTTAPTNTSGSSMDGSVTWTFLYFDLTDWAAGTSYNEGQLIKAGARIYKALINGTTGTTAPSHAIGTATDGNIVWEFITWSITFWASGVNYATDSLVVANGMFYRSTTSGTSGTTPLINTSGTQSDGGVTWQFLNFCVGIKATTDSNSDLQIINNKVTRFGVGISVLIENGNLSQISGNTIYQTAANAIRIATAGPNKYLKHLIVSENRVTSPGINTSTQIFSIDTNNLIIDFADLTNNIIEGDFASVKNCLVIYTPAAPVSGMIRTLDIRGLKYYGTNMDKADINLNLAQRVIGYKNSLPPYDGNWLQGDRVENSLPSSGAYFGWTCITPGPLSSITWAATTDYGIGRIIKSGSNYYRCKLAGKSSGTAPTATTPTVIDGTVTWEFLAASPAVFKGYGGPIQP